MANTDYSESLCSYFDMSEVNGRGLLKLEIKEEGVGGGFRGRSGLWEGKGVGGI